MLVFVWASYILIKSFSYIFLQKHRSILFTVNSG